MNDKLAELAAYIKDHNGINDKSRLAQMVATRFDLVQDRSVYYGRYFAIRFSKSRSASFSNTVLSLSNLQKHDDKPFIVCVVTPGENHLLLANTSFLRKISHSSQELRENSIRGSFNGSDIIRDFEGIKNHPENFERLFLIHNAIDFEDNLKRLVEATNNITAMGKRFEVSDNNRSVILDAPSRAQSFVASVEFRSLKADLDSKVLLFQDAILAASFIENVNVRGRVIEYLITGADEQLRQELIASIINREIIPQFRTAHNIGDYTSDFDNYFVETDVKTKIMFLNSNPKGYNIDKMLEFLSLPRTVFMFYFIGIDSTAPIDTLLVSLFEEKIQSSTIILKHWSGRNSRGVTQLEGSKIKELILSQETSVRFDQSRQFLEDLIAL